MSVVRISVADKRRKFRELHQAGCFVIPNPWDIGSALYLQSLGFQALATTSSGFAWSIGRADNQITRDQALAHIRHLVDATDVPINADFENGFGDSPTAVQESVTLAVHSGVAGLSIEDATGNAQHPLFDTPEAVERLRAARRAIDRAGGEVMLIARAERYLMSTVEEAIARLQAYAAAGADCLYAPGLKSRQEIAAVVQAVAPKPVNLLIGAASDLTMQDAAALGVRRVSVGGALARSAWGGFMRAAQQIAEHGRFDGFKDAASGAELDQFFGEE